MPKATQTYDAVIIGGALTGSLAFLALAESFIKHNKSLLLVERAPQPREDNRMLALGMAAVRLLQELDLWTELEPYAQAVTSLELNYAATSQVITAPQSGLPRFGWTVPHAILQRILWDKLHTKCTAHANLELSCPFNLEKFQLDSTPARLVGKQGELKAQLLLVCAGAGFLREVSGLINYKELNTIDTCPHFAVARVKLKSYQAARGYWFGGAGQSTLALTPTAVAGEYVAILALQPPVPELGLAAFRTRLAAACPYQLEVPEQQLVIYPALSYLATERVKGPLVLLGNAAHNIAPLGGQNFNLTIWTLGVLHKLLAAALESPTFDREFLAAFVAETQAPLRQHLGLIQWLDEQLSRPATHRTSRLLEYLAGELLTNNSKLVRALRGEVFAYASGIRR